MLSLGQVWVRLAATFFLLVIFLAASPTASSARVARQSPDHNLIDATPEEESEHFINVSELKNLDLAELLEINFVNKSVSHYRNKINEVHLSLKSRVNDLLATARGGHSEFSPELKQKLNESFFKLIESLQLSPECLFSLNHLRMEITERRLWPLKCECDLSFPVLIRQTIRIIYLI